MFLTQQCHTHRATTKNWSICRSVSGLFGSQTLTSNFDCSLSSDSPVREQRKWSLVTHKAYTLSHTMDDYGHHSIKNVRKYSRFWYILSDGGCRTVRKVNTDNNTSKPTMQYFHLVIRMYFLSTCMCEALSKPPTKRDKDKKESTPAARRLNYDKTYP